jgi:putative addiction module component (TIGR02574 family)
MATVTVSDLLHLSASERIRLAVDLWDSVAVDPGSVPVTEAQRRLVRARSEAHRRNPSMALDLDPALDDIERSLD